MTFYDSPLEQGHVGGRTVRTLGGEGPRDIFGWLVAGFEL